MISCYTYVLICWHSVIYYHSTKRRPKARPQPMCHVWQRLVLSLNWTSFMKPLTKLCKRIIISYNPSKRMLMPMTPMLVFSMGISGSILSQGTSCRSLYQRWQGVYISTSFDFDCRFAQRLIIMMPVITANQVY